MNLENYLELSSILIKQNKMRLIDSLDIKFDLYHNNQAKEFVYNNIQSDKTQLLPFLIKNGLDIKKNHDLNILLLKKSIIDINDFKNLNLINLNDDEIEFFSLNFIVNKYKYKYQKNLLIEELKINKQFIDEKLYNKLIEYCKHYDFMLSDNNAKINKEYHKYNVDIFNKIIEKTYAYNLRNFISKHNEVFFEKNISFSSIINDKKIYENNVFCNLSDKSILLLSNKLKEDLINKNILFIDLADKHHFLKYIKNSFEIHNHFLNIFTDQKNDIKVKFINNKNKTDFHYFNNFLFLLNKSKLEEPSDLIKNTNTDEIYIYLEFYLNNIKNINNINILNNFNKLLIKNLDLFSINKIKKTLNVLKDYSNIDLTINNYEKIKDNLVKIKNSKIKPDYINFIEKIILNNELKDDLESKLSSTKKRKI